MNPNTLFQIATWLIPLIIAIVFHEVSHGLVARRLGDPTAEERGRLSLNPLRHIDLFGTVILPLLLAISHAPIFGWAKPVPVNYRRLRNPRRDMVLVALAGPGMNLLLAVLGAVVLAATLSLLVRPERPRDHADRRQCDQLRPDQSLPRDLQPAPDPAVRRRPRRPGPASARSRAQLRQDRPLFAAGADGPAASVADDRDQCRRPLGLAAGRPYRDGIAGDVRRPPLRCCTAGSSSTSRSAWARPRR